MSSIARFSHVRQKCFSFLALALLTLLAACPTPKSGVFEACQEYKRIIDCEANLRARPSVSLNCASLAKKFDTLCSKNDIAYAHETFKSDADRMCALKTESELKGFKSSFDQSKVTPACFQAAEPCGLNCMQFDVNEVP